MLDHDDLKRIATASTDLNSILQQISRYCDLARRHKGEHNYIELLGERVELAAKTAQALFDHVTSQILAGTTGKATPPAAPAGLKQSPSFSVVPPPIHTVPPRSQTALSLPIEEKTERARASKPAGRAGQKESETRVSAPVRLKNPKGNREYVLLIEDETEVADLAAQMLAEEGYKVITAHDGFEALDIYRRMGKQIGLVILDFFLPVMDGDAVFDELRAINPEINVVLSSGFAEQSKIASMLTQGLRGFIPKPYTREKLLEQVRSTLDAARQPAH